jgi:uncharacterized membrane protein
MKKNEPTWWEKIQSLIPEKLTLLGRLFFAVAIIGLGIEHFIFQDFMIGRAPAWPESVPGGVIWAYLTGIGFIAVSISIISGKKARYASFLAAVLIFLWALLRHIPIVAGDSLLSPSWTSAGKALVFFGGALAIAGTFREEQNSRNNPLLKFVNLSSEFIVLGRICLGIFLIITGIQHFIYTEFVASLIPQWFPGDSVFWTYFGGVALMSGGVGLIIPQTALLAAFFSGLMIFLWFWIIHIPRTFTSVSDGIAVFEALAFSGIAFVLAGFLSKTSNIQLPKNLPSFLMVCSLIII